MYIKAPAKINLHLNVGLKRSDGFHALESIFQTIPLFDELDVRINDEIGTCNVSCKELSLPSENTLTKAYKNFCFFTGIQKGIDIELIKKIPFGAGMGGGSSDAASLLIALNKMFDEPLSDKKLKEAALQVGSDVPFFIDGGVSVVTGRGEFLHRISARNDLSFVLIYPGVYSSTAQAYQLVDEFNSHKKESKELCFDELEKMYYKPVKEWKFFNSFTEPMVKKYHKIFEALEILKNMSAEFVDMTGSGSVVYGVFEDCESAKRVYTKLCNEWKWCCCLLSSDSLYG